MPDLRDLDVPYLGRHRALPDQLQQLVDLVLVALQHRMYFTVAGFST